MKLLEIGIHNYKSLRSVTVRPGPLSVFVGPNAAGKSNFCDALDFLGEMYRWGLELAIARHGGYENICYRHTRRSKSPIEFFVRASLGHREGLGAPGSASRRRPRTESVTLEHRIVFGTASQTIKAPFSIVSESIDVLTRTDGDSGLDKKLISIRRSGQDITSATIDTSGQERQSHVFPEISDQDAKEQLSARLVETESAILLVNRLLYVAPFIFRWVRSPIRIFQLDPSHCRETGVPTPNPELERSGVNLPAVIEFIKDHRPRQYESLINTLRAVMPSLGDLDVVITPQKTLGLSFHETGFGRPWTSEDVSDGTIRAVALLAAIFDPAIDVIVVEEPENSLHPWAIRQFVEACRSASGDKQIVLTTHSPVLINQLKPDEIWVVQRPRAETKIDALTSLAPDSPLEWESGSFSLSEYLDAGAVPAAVPAPPP